MTIGIAGSTARTRQVAETLTRAGAEVLWVLTPAPKPIGRKQILTKNPLHLWAEESNTDVCLIEKKIDSEVQTNLTQLPQPDLLLVVDFGYLVPKWLLELPRLAPLNIHPSELPRWRGSSPAQFSLLYGDRKSAVTLMVMDELLDHGPIITQLPFDVDPSWTQVEYYQHSFELMCDRLPELLEDFISNRRSTPQPEVSPTLIAGQLTKEDSFVSWSVLKQLLTHPQAPIDATLLGQTSQLLQDVQQSTQEDWSIILERAARAFHPWPNLWTLVPTSKGEKRLKIFSIELNPFKLDRVQLEGQEPASWNQIRNTIVSS